MEAAEEVSKPIVSKTLVTTISEIYRRQAQQENRIYMKISDRMKDCNCEAISTEIWTMTDYRVTQRERTVTRPWRISAGNGRKERRKVRVQLKPEKTT